MAQATFKVVLTHSKPNAFKNRYKWCYGNESSIFHRVHVAGFLLNKRNYDTAYKLIRSKVMGENGTKD
jgi:hypothetical protein